MSYSKKVLSLLLVISTIPASVFSAQTVTLPTWFSDADSMTQMMNGIASDFASDISWMQLWKNNVQAQLVEIDKRNVERRQVYDCIRASFEAKDAEIASCNLSVAERNALIAALESNITALEATIASLTAQSNSLQSQIADIHSAYATLLELNGDRVDDLLAEINVLRGKYQEMNTERALFRTTLSDYYTRIAAHHYDAKTEGRAFGKEICGSDFDFVQQ